MFYSITGEIVYADTGSLALETSGVAFRISTSLNTLKTVGGVGRKTTLYTYLSVREDALELYGFSTPKELEFFKMLMTVQNVGPKAALSVLSVHTPESLVFAVVSGDSKSIARAQNVGPKTAQRIILELKDKFAGMMPSEVSAADCAVPQFNAVGNISEAQTALTGLGYSQAEAAKALAGLDGSMSVEDLLKAAFKKLM